MDTTEMLDQLAELRGGLDATYESFQPRMDALNQEILDATLELAPKIATLEYQIKDAVLAEGASVKGTTLTASFVKGRVSWDTRALDGYAVTHVEIVPFRKEGKPSVRIQARKA